MGRCRQKGGRGIAGLARVNVMRGVLVMSENCFARRCCWLGRVNASKVFQATYRTSIPVFNSDNWRVEDVRLAAIRSLPEYPAKQVSFFDQALQRIARCPE